MSEDTRLKELIINTLSPEQFEPITPSETEIYLVEDDVEYASVDELNQGLATKQDIISDLSTIRTNASSAKSTVDTHVANTTIHVTASDKTAWSQKQNAIYDLDDIRSNAQAGKDIIPQVNVNTQRIEDLTTAKFPNVVIVGTPHIEGGQVSNYSDTSYLQFPFVDISRGQPFDIYFSFTTAQDVTTQQNILDGYFGIALAIQNGKGIMALSSNGTSWDIGTSVGTNALLPNTTYYVKYSWTGTEYSAALSTDDQTYVPDMNLASTLSPHKTTIFIGGSPNIFGAGSAHPFKGTINFNKSKVVVNGITVWEGMADVGLASRANVSLNNLDEVGEGRFNAKQDTLIAGKNITIENNVIGVTGLDISKSIENLNSDGISPLKLWEGTEEQWEKGGSKTWYNWTSGENTVGDWATSGTSLSNLVRVVYGNGVYVMTAYSTTSYVYSTDAINWSRGTMPRVVDDVLFYANGLFLGVRAGESYCIYSTDGVNWNETTLPSRKSWRRMTYGNGMFILVADDTNVYVYSTDGINWTQGTLPVSGRWYTASFGNGLFLITEGNTDSASKAVYSSDGINWTQKNITRVIYYGSAFGSGKFVVCGYGNTYIYSSDCVNWNTGTLPSSGSWYITYGSGMFMAVNRGANSSIYSYDGINWNTKTMPSSQYWESITYGNNKFITASYSSSNYQAFYIPVTVALSAFTDTSTPDTSSTVYSAPSVESSLTITETGTNTITLSDGNVYDRNQDGDIRQGGSIGDAYPESISYITDSKELKCGNETIANLNASWGTIVGNISEQNDLQDILDSKQPVGNYATKTELNSKQDVITDLATIRDGASKGATALQSFTETDPTVPSYVKSITQANITDWNNKSTFSGDYNDLTNKPTIPTVPTNISAFTNDSGYITSSYHDSSKQDTLVSGTNIKTIDGESILGSGDIEVSSYHPSLLSFQWTDHILNEMSWLRADTFSWQSGDVYTSVYNHLVEDFNNAPVVQETLYGWDWTDREIVYTKSLNPVVGDKVFNETGSEINTITSVGSGYIETSLRYYDRNSYFDTTITSSIKTDVVDGVSIEYYLSSDGHKIALSSQEQNIINAYNSTGVAWYYILDTANRRFKLPRTKYGFTGLRDSVGKYVPESLPNVKGNLGLNISYQNPTAPFYIEQSGGADANRDNTGWTTKFDLSLSSSTYQDNAPVQQRATQMYLYFYVGEFSQTAIEQTAGITSEQLNGKADISSLNNKIQKVSVLPATQQTGVLYVIPE